ncbi:serine/threonine-protein kinase [Streptomyces sp. CA-250714]|uniref:serine/threonine-protein kinase n=1 Tax=Streptomyces sp. CA-250714 TaxID=3240060 RepID=UPI003D8CD6CA
MPSPDLIGRYRVERRLGSGAFAVVWLAHDDRLEAPVAVKVMADNWAHRMDIRERFLAEARLLRRASSGGVVQVFDVGELDDERPYFVMEHADRGTVADRMTAGPLPVPEALRLTSEAAHGVEALHESGVVHRDIKPSNVLLTSGGAQGRERVLVADLGLAKNLAQASGLTVVAGSVGYMAPEQAEPFEGIDARADIYSLGAVLYHLVTGAVPGTPERVMPLDELRPGLPPEMARAVARAMEPDRERRWPTAAAFADELDRIATELDRNPPPEGGPDEFAAEPGRGGDGRGSFASSASQVSFLAVRPVSQVPGQPSTVATDPPSRGARKPVGGGSEGGSSASEPAASAGSAASESSLAQESAPEKSRLGAAGSKSFASESSAAEPAASESAVSGASDPQTPGPQASVAGPRGAPGATARATPRRGRRRAVAIGSAAVVLAGAGVASSLLMPKDPGKAPSSVRVHDASGQISVRIPGVWADEMKDSGWRPSSLGLSAKRAPGLLVTEDVGSWHDLTSGTNGVFVGLGSSADEAEGADGADKGTPSSQGAADSQSALPDKVAELEHKGCQYTGSRNFKGGGWQGQVRTWSACGAPRFSLEEIGLSPQQKGKPPVYVQIRCNEDCSARTDRVLSSLRVNESAS